MKLCCRMSHPGQTLPLAVLALFLFASAGRADRLDEVPREGRAALAAAACAYSPQQAPALYPDRPDFRPEAAPGYLQTYRPGELYEATIQVGGVDVTFSILQFPEEATAAQKFAEWQQEWRESVKLAPWPEVSAPVYLSGRGLLGVVEPNFGRVGRAQLGPWHFEVSALVRELDASKQEREDAAIRAHFPKLLENAQRFRLLPHQLVIEYFPGRGRPAVRLTPNQPFRLSLEVLEETRATFRVYVLDSRNQQTPHVRYQVRLNGPLAQFAQIDRDGARSAGTEQVFEDASDPVLVKWVFPAVSDTAFAAALERATEGGADVSLDVEARFTPTLRPPA